MESWQDKLLNKHFGEGSDPKKFDDYAKERVSPHIVPIHRSTSKASHSHHSHGDDYFQGSQWEPKQACYHTHPALKLGEYVIYGGNCGSPVVKDADIYIGFEHGMQRQYPWDGKVSFEFYIQDMGVPKDYVGFKKMVAWVADQLREGKKVHAGCIGGHGRTGTFFAALVAHMGVSDDAIAYVREHYCHKAVESKEQVDFLEKHFGVKPAKGAKSSYSSAPTQSNSKAPKGSKGGKKGSTKGLLPETTLTGSTYTPVKSSQLSIWGQT